jgi:hypothetical protein
MSLSSHVDHIWPFVRGSGKYLKIMRKSGIIVGGEKYIILKSFKFLGAGDALTGLCFNGQQDNVVGQRRCFDRPCCGLPPGSAGTTLAICTWFEICNVAMCMVVDLVSFLLLIAEFCFKKLRQLILLTHC